MSAEPPGVASARALLVGREISAISFVRDYVEVHFDGPIVRAISNPYGMYGCRGWRFPDGQSAEVMRHYIGKVVDGFRFVNGEYLAIDSGEHSFIVPLGDESRVGPEAVHIVGVDERGCTDPSCMWIW